jgi:hypothetical protein
MPVARKRLVIQFDHDYVLRGERAAVCFIWKQTGNTMEARILRRMVY